jgi:ATP-binding cassette subfamily F protein 3
MLLIECIVFCTIIWPTDYKGNFTQFYATKSERAKNQRREYESQLQYRQHLQAFIDRWRYNANRAAQAQSKIKILEKLPELEPPEDDDVVHFKFAPTDKLTPPLLQLEDCSFGYSTDKPILKHVNIDGVCPSNNLSGNTSLIIDFHCL